MFRDWYKKANDDILPDADLLERVLAQKPRRRPNHRKLYSLGAAAAGICIVSATLLSYPVLRDLNKEDSGLELAPPDCTAVETCRPVHTAQTAETPKPAERPAVAPADTAKAPIKRTADPEPAKKTVIPQKTDVPQKTKEPVKTPEPRQETPVPAQTQTPAAAPEQSLVQDGIQQPAEQSMGAPAVRGVTSDQVELVSVEWTKADYAAYLGVDVEEKIYVPADLENITPDARNMSVYKETKQPYYDVWAYKYKSADSARALTVKTTKIQENLSVADGEEFTIGDAAAVVSKTETGTQAVFHKDGVWYMVKAEGLLEEEWTQSCKSMIE